MSKVFVAKSYWRFSGRYWTFWSGTWAALIAVVVAMPEPDTKKAAYAQKPRPQVASAAASASTPAVVSVVVKRFDLSALPASAFGDHDLARPDR